MTGVALRDARPPLVLVLDAGSSSLRASVYDALARLVEGWDAQEKYDLRVTPDGGVEEDAEDVMPRITAVIDRVLDAAGSRAGDICAVGMASYASTLVGVAADGAPLTPVYAYSDTRPAAEVQELRARLDERAVQQRTGCRIHTSYLPARLLWLCRTAPDSYHAVQRWMSLPEYLYARLLGDTHAGYSIASWSGLLNRATLTWDEEWLGLLKLDRAALSRIDDRPLTGLRPTYAQRWPALAQVPWFPAYADGAASNIGSGCATPTRAALSIGTSGAIRVVMESPQTLPAGLWCYRVDRQRALVGGALNDAGGMIAWARESLRFEDFERAEAQVGEAAPDGHGLTVLPFLTGERSPGWNADLRAAIIGIHRHTGPVDLLQALMEAVAYRFALVAGDLAQSAPGITAVVASGGGAAQSPVWVQMVADVLGREVALAAEQEATSRGIALLVLASLGENVDAIPPVKLSRTFHPRPDRHARYQAAIARQQEVYDLIAAWTEQHVPPRDRGTEKTDGGG